MKAKTRVVLEDCIESGILLGWNTAHKHIEDPDTEVIIKSLQQSITERIYEYFSFDDDEWN